VEYWVYDIEQYPNFHSCCAINVETGEKKDFVIHQSRDDRIKYLAWLNELQARGAGMIGYNNLKYDYPIIHHIIENAGTMTSIDLDVFLMDLYDHNEKIFNSEFSEVAPWKTRIHQIDLFRIWHYDNKARATSLKWVEFSLRMDNVEDLPILPGSFIKTGDIESLIDYNYNDVEATLEFYKTTRGDTENSLYKGKDKLKLREKFSNKYGLDLTNANDPKIGSELILHLYCKKTGKNPKDVVKLRTYRSSIDIGKCIFDYVEFKTPEFNAVLDFFKKKTITSTKGAFSEISPKEMGSLAKYASKKSDSWSVKNQHFLKVNTIFNDFQYDYGTGGIHGSKQGLFKSDDKYVIMDSDVASLYPNIAIENNLYPEHLGPEFLEVYKDDIVNTRLLHKALAKDKSLSFEERSDNKMFSDGLKLSANGAYGKSNDQYSFLYDPLYTMKTTINGQLLLSMLAEMLELAIDDFEMIQINTDGLTARIPREDVNKWLEVCKEWEAKTRLVLEHAYYDLMAVSNVNNYIAREEESGYVKYKGWFEIDKELHKNNSARIVPIALSKYFLEGIPVEDTIRNHNDILDYCLGVKARKSPHHGKSSYSYHSVSNQSYKKVKLPNKTNRYYISNKGGTLIKDYEDGHSEFVNKGFQSTLFNKKFITKDFDINYNFYIDECYKIIDVIEEKETNQLSMF
jgi:hypothetical protein